MNGQEDLLWRTLLQNTEQWGVVGRERGARRGY
jgi:hypothetical protein